MSCKYVRPHTETHERRLSYVLLVARKVNLPPLAFSTQTGDVTREVEHRALLVENGGGICRWSSHVESTDMLAASGQVPQGDELGCSWGGHVG